MAERTEVENKVWALFEKGMTDNEILDALVAEGVEAFTYMDLRILRADYEAEHPETVEQEEPDEPEENTEEDEGIVTIDTVTKPGALMSGSANLPSGAKISWGLDRTGRINMVPEGDKEPTQADLQAFQQELQQQLQKRGGII